MTFGQRRNCLTTHFSERIPVVKRRISVFLVNVSVSILYFHIQPSPFRFSDRSTVFCLIDELNYGVSFIVFEGLKKRQLCIRKFLCMYHASCTVYYPHQQMHYIYIFIYIYINNILYIVSTPPCFVAPASLVIPKHKKHQHMDDTNKTATKLTASAYYNYNSSQRFINCVLSSTVTLTYVSI